MVKLTSPISLQTAKGFITTTSEDFSQRLAGNYGIMGAHYTPKDLLYLLTAPTELPEDLGGMTTIAIENRTSSFNTISMNVINNVVNRILLDGTTSFTYQDQVYITSVLNRIGITDVQQFINQVRQLREQTQSVMNIRHLYRDTLKQMAIRNQQREYTPALPLHIAQVS